MLQEKTACGLSSSCYDYTTANSRGDYDYDHDYCSEDNSHLSDCLCLLLERCLHRQRSQAVRRSSLEFTETFPYLSLSLCPCSLAAPACFACLSLCRTHLLFGVPMSSHVAPLPPVVKRPRYPLSKSPPLRTVFFPHPAFFPRETAFLLGFLQGSKGSVDVLFGHFTIS